LKNNFVKFHDHLRDSSSLLVHPYSYIRAALIEWTSEYFIVRAQKIEVSFSEKWPLALFKSINNVSCSHKITDIIVYL